jgi:hypothetical protein
LADFFSRRDNRRKEGRLFHRRGDRGDNRRKEVRVDRGNNRRRLLENFEDDLAPETAARGGFERHHGGVEVFLRNSQNGALFQNMEHVQMGLEELAKIQVLSVILESDGNLGGRGQFVPTGGQGDMGLRVGREAHLLQNPVGGKDKGLFIVASDTDNATHFGFDTSQMGQHGLTGWKQVNPFIHEGPGYNDFVPLFSHRTGAGRKDEGLYRVDGFRHSGYCGGGCCGCSYSCID